MKIGDRVSVIDDAITGTVVRFENAIVVVNTTDDFEMEFDVKELVVMNETISKSEFLPQDLQEVLSEKTERKNKNTTRVKPKERTLPPMVVDLHIHHLVPKSGGMSNYDMLTVQIETAKRQLDFAISKRIQRIVFIHGVGEGILRAELEYLFRQYGNLEYNDADFQKYGRGATEVYVFQNKKV